MFDNRGFETEITKLHKSCAPCNFVGRLIATSLVVQLRFERRRLWQ
ncbi:MAG: hypothetical protein LBP89_02630 [Helicobacteraceae bacterium]|nr:hypothetical protein [Helicobacteraceae bacterium]